MSRAVLELNDSELLVARAGRVLARSPGVAVIRGDGIELGEAALRRARLDPRQTFSRFWYELNQDPLRTPSGAARHHADLAYAQLQQLHEKSGRPGELVVAVPGSFSAEQLALLLGIAEAVPMKIVGLVDAAVAAAAAAAGPGLHQHVDLHLHHAVVTQLEVGEQARRTAVKVVDGAGLAAVHDRCAAAIADLFIQQARLDPLHHASTEQALYDQLPGCIANLGRQGEVLLEIHFSGTRYQVRLPRAQLQRALNPVFEKITAAADAHAGWLLSHRLASLPRGAEHFPGARVLPESAVIEGCARFAPPPAPAEAGLSFVTQLQAAAQPAGAHEPAAPPATETTRRADESASHLLVGDRAYRISAQPLYLAADGSIAPARRPGTLCAVALAAGGARVELDGASGASLNGRALNGSTPLRPGDRLQFAGSALVVAGIRVIDGDGAQQA